MGTIIGWLALVVGIAALGYGWKLHQELQTAARRLDRYNRALFDANDEIRQLREDLTTATSELRVEIMRNSGQLRFSPDLSVREAQLIHPQAEQILAGFHLGGCSSCAVSPDDSLAKICQDAGVGVDALVDNLNQLVATPSGLNGKPPQLVKIPNVEVSF